MLQDLKEDHQINEIEILATYVNGLLPFPKQLTNQDTYKYFENKGYLVIRPYSKAVPESHEVCEFFKTQKTFAMEPSDLEDTHVVYIYCNVRKEIIFAASLLVFEISRVFLVVISAIKVNPSVQRKGFGSIFIGNIAKYMASTTKDTNYTSACMVTQQYRKLKPHGFYQKLGFVAAPSVLDSWRVKYSDLAVCSLEQFYGSDAYKQKQAPSQTKLQEEVKNEDSVENIDSHANNEDSEDTAKSNK